MKKLFLTLIMLGLVSNMPAFALKLIVNDQNDRVVYSRSSKPDPDEYIEENYEQQEANYNTKEETVDEFSNTDEEQIVEETTDEDVQTTVNVVKPGYAHLKELSENLKPEMIGTTWVYDYSEYMEEPVEEINEEITEETTEEPAEEEITEYNEESNTNYVDEQQSTNPLDLDPTLKKSSREAADYYTRDLNDGNPDLVPSGYEPEI
jgi:hypothetical protein